MLCDVIVLYCMKKRNYYREKKYKYVEDYEQVGPLLKVPAPCFLHVSHASGEHPEYWARP